jgi:hypothetical protein
LRSQIQSNQIKLNQLKANQKVSQIKSTQSQIQSKQIKASRWRSGRASVSNTRGSGFGPRQRQGFSSSYETPELLGAGNSHVLWMTP